VSVVVIVRNGERFLAEALESIRAQEFGAWEAIVVDDGSDDGTLRIAESFADAEPDRFRVVRHPGGANRGMSASRNLGVRHARGELVTFLDHDDCMLPERLRQHVAELDRHADAVAVIGPNIRWCSWRAGGVDSVQDLGVALGALHPVPGPLPVFLVRTNATPQAPIVRRAWVESIGGFEDEFRDMYEDQVFLAKLFLSGSVWVSEHATQRYRQHQDSCVHRAHRKGAHHAARARFLRWLLARLNRTGGPPGLVDGVRRELRRLRWRRLRAWIGLDR
jgi:GT2 family glycosyltransferase